MSFRPFVFGRTVLAALLAAVVLCAETGDGGEPAVSAELRDDAVRVLRDVLGGSPGEARLRAAEYLISLDYRQGVREALEADLAAGHGRPRYYAGLWEGLARAAVHDNDRLDWLTRLERVAFDPSAAERPRALEALGRLGWTPRPHQAKVLEELAASDNKRLQIYGAWLGAISGTTSGGQAAEQRLAGWLSDADASVRAHAAYALSHLDAVSEETRRALGTAAASEPRHTLARGSLLRAAYRHAASEQAARWKDALLEGIETAPARRRLEACAGLARRGGNQDLAVLKRLIGDGDPGVRAAAAHAILRIGRRVPHRLAMLDWTAIVVYLIGMLLVGAYYSRRVKTTEDYLLGGRNMRPWAVGLSLFATLLSTLSYVALPGEVIKYGPMIVSQIIAAPVVVVIAGWVLIPRIMKMRVTSAYEILQARLGTSIRLFGALIFLTIRLFWMAAIIYATSSKILVPVLGLEQHWYPVIGIVLAAVTLTYTSMGGLKAVVFTDVVQTFILIGGALLTLGTITVVMGGVDGWWPQVWAESWQEPKFGFETGARVTVGFAFLSGLIWHVCTAGSDQMAIQRYLATRDVKAARRAMITHITTDGVMMLFIALMGLALFGYFQSNPHMIPDGQTIQGNADQLFPRFIVFGLPVGISGLVIAGLLATAMSSLSSGVNSSCSVITVDFISRFRKRKIKDEEHVRLAKYISVFVGVVVLGLTFFVSIVPGNLLEVINRVVNLLVAPLFVLFFLAMFVPSATTFGAWVGVLCGIADAVAIAFWELFTGEPGPSFLWIMPTSLLVGAVTGVLASYLPVGPKARPPLAQLAERK